MVTYDARPSPFTNLTQTLDWEYLFSAANIDDGIDNTQGGSMAPSLDTGGRNAVIAAGNAIIKGQLWRCDASVSTPIPGASAQNRIDRLVLQYNRGATTSPTVIQPLVVTGTPGSSPTEPPLTQTPGGIWQIPICSWTSASSGALSGLADERQIIQDSWHTLALPGSPSGLSGSARYKMVQYHMVLWDFNITWATPSGQTWQFPTPPQPYWASVPGGQSRIYPFTGNGVLNVGSNSNFPRIYYSALGVIQLITPANMDNGTGSLTVMVPTD